MIATAFSFVAPRRPKREIAKGLRRRDPVASFVATWWLYTPEIVWLQMFATGLIAFIGAGFWTLWGSIAADVVDYDELKGGNRREGAFASSNSWINKFGMALGAGISFFILDWIGFDSKLGGAQTEDTPSWFASSWRSSRSRTMLSPCLPSPASR